MCNDGLSPLRFCLVRYDGAIVLSTLHYMNVVELSRGKGLQFKQEISTRGGTPCESHVDLYTNYQQDFSLGQLLLFD